MCFRLLKYNLDFKIEFALPCGEKSAELAAGHPVDGSGFRNRTAGGSRQPLPGSRRSGSNKSGLSYKV